MVESSRSNAEMRTPVLLSVGAHVFVFVAAIVNFNFFSPPPLEPEPVMVDFVAIAKKAAAPKIGIQPPQPKEAKITEEKTKAEDPKPVEDKIAMKPKEPEPPKVEKPPDPKPDPKPEVKKPDPKPVTPPPKPQTKKTKVDNLVDSILKNTDSKTKIQTPEQQPKPVKEITRQASVAPDFASVVTASEIEGVRQKIRPCWNSFGGAKEAPIVTLVVQMNQDGTPVKADIKETSRYNSDPVYRAATDSAYRAIMNPRCHPWPLSPEKYNSWRIITFNFDPRDY